MLKAKDIAKMIGVSTATVSLVLNNKPGVSDRRREEIIQKINELGAGYMLGENILNSGNIGFVVYRRDGSIVDESPFFTYILQGITDTARKHGYTLNFIYLNHSMPITEQKQHLENAKCRGLIIFAVEMFHEDLRAFKESGIPFVILDNTFQEHDVDAVAINNAQGTSKAVRHLCEMGHEHIGYIKSKVVINSFKERFTAFARELKNQKLKLNKADILEVGYSEKEVRQDTMEFVRACRPIPTAFFAENDLIACNAVRAFKEMGLRVPEDVSVIGFDDRPICTMIEPNLTTIEVPKHILGPEVVELLVAKILKEREYSIKIEVGTKLAIRDSVRNLNEN